MELNVINKIAEILGKNPNQIEASLEGMPIDDLYALIDATNSDDSITVKQIMDPILDSWLKDGEKPPVKQLPAATDQETETQDDDSVKESQHLDEDWTINAKFSKDYVMDDFADDLSDMNVAYSFHPNNILSISCKSREEAYTVDRELQLQSNRDRKLQISRPYQDADKINLNKHEPSANRLAEAKRKTSGQIPKPRDPMAKALALPQYQPKSTPSKKELMNKKDSKHKKSGDIMDENLKEGFMGMTDMSALNRMLTLAGISPQDAADLNDAGNIESPEYQTIELGNTLGNAHEVDPASPIAPGVIGEPELEYAPDYTDDLNNQLTAAMADNQEGDTSEYHLDGINVPLDAMVGQDDGMEDLTNIQVVRNSFHVIKSNLRYLQIGDFAELRALVSDLNSTVDRISNLVTGKK